MSHVDVGKSYSEKFRICTEVVDRFVAFSGDHNPIHLNERYARAHGYARPVAHGVIQLAYLSKIIGTHLPGSGALWVAQTVEWKSPVFINDEINVCAEVVAYSSSTGLARLQIEVFNQKKKMVMEGEAVVQVTTALTGEEERTGVTASSSTGPNRRAATSSFESRDAVLTEGRVALVTGGSRGIGAEVSKNLAVNGYEVIINFIEDEAAADMTVSEIIAQGGRAIKHQLDIGDNAQVKSMADMILDRFGRCDVVIHTATPQIERIKVNEMEYASLERYFNVYLGGAIALVNLLSPRMIEQKFGRFIFLGSSGLFGKPPEGMTPYLMAKEALWGYVRGVSSEIGLFGITANLVSPSLTVTDLTNDVPARIKEIEACKSPARRLARTEDSAALISFLCSDEAGYINGANIPVTGGSV